MGDLTYIDGLRAAEALCAERSKRAVREAKSWESESDKASCLSSALEALECAIAIKRLAEETSKAERLVP